MSIQSYLSKVKWHKHDWVWHTGFWLVYLTLRLGVVHMYHGSLGFRLGMELIEIPLKVVSLYVVVYILIGRLLVQKRYYALSFAFAFSILITMWLNRAEDYFIIHPLTKIAYVHYESGFWSWPVAFANLIYIYPVVGLGASVFFVRSWFENVLSQERLAREKAEVELKSLKDQIHPHFLFNTLNNIYSLSLAQSKLVSDMILRLSKLLSYVTYDCNAPFVSLAKEVDALKDYVALEKLRLQDRLNLSFEVTGSIDRVKIAPLLLFPLLENCFKHGSHQTVENVWIRVHLTVHGTEMVVQIENSLPSDHVSNKNGQGIGLTNVNRRLALLYPTHEIRIHEHDTFLVYLKINTNDTMPNRG
jgi:two-component system, LytTR family, sensor kinase